MNGKKLLKIICVTTIACVLVSTIGVFAARGGGRGGGRGGRGGMRGGGGRMMGGRGGRGAGFGRGRGYGRRGYYGGRRGGVSIGIGGGIGFGGRGYRRGYGRRRYGRGGIAIGIGGGIGYGRRGWGRRGYYGRRHWRGYRPYRRGWRGGWWRPYNRWGWGWGFDGPWWWWRPGIAEAIVLSEGTRYANDVIVADSAGYTWWEVANGSNSDIIFDSSNGGRYRIPAGGVGKIYRGTNFDFAVQIGNRRGSANTSNHFILVDTDQNGQLSIQSWPEAPQKS